MWKGIDPEKIEVKFDQWTEGMSDHKVIQIELILEGEIQLKNQLGIEVVDKKWLKQETRKLLQALIDANTQEEIHQLF